ncbi:sensor histidine kinase [Clostridium baratii]|uniref:sensor histidine kinase n=1 Tax=Clostridium baratii TaxID=1561 RepID=UPI0036F2F928
MTEANILFLIASIFIAVYNIFIIKRLDDNLNFFNKNSIYFFMTSMMILSLICFYLDNYILENIIWFTISINIIVIFTKKNKGVVLFLVAIISTSIVDFQNIVFSYYEIITNNSISEFSNSIQTAEKTAIIVLYISLVVINIRSTANLIINNSKYIEKSLENEKGLGIKAIMIFFYMINMGFVHYLYALDNSRGFSYFIGFCSIMNLLTGGFMIRNSIIKGRAKEFKEKGDILNEQIKNQYNHYIELEKYYSEIFRIKHDINNHNNIISVLLQNGEYDELKNYMDKYNENIINLDNEVLICKNKIIDAICLSKRSICKESGIDIKFDIKVPEVINIDDLDLCIIYGNILDNAIEACNRIADQSKEKFIDIKSNIVKGYLTIKIVNSKDGVSIKRNGKFITLKKDKKNHGIGLYSVQKSVDKYNGQVILKDKEEVFTTCIIVKCKGT